MKLPYWLLKLWAKFAPRRSVQLIEGDTPPARLKSRNLYLAREDDEDWAVAFTCPCGCGDRLELILIPEARPNWTIYIDDDGYPTLHPSVWRKAGCKSHFWLLGGRIRWV